MILGTAAAVVFGPQFFPRASAVGSTLAAFATFAVAFGARPLGGVDDVVTDFNAAQGDRIMFDYGTYSDVMVFGRLSDGLTWQNFNGTARFTVSASDVNGDGVTDTVISANDDSITLLGVAPDQLWGSALFGG